ncbi:MAG: apolipoprotein N-acyltransferase [Acidimicrobiales bacterium]
MSLVGRRSARIGLPLLGGALIGCSLPPLAPWPVGVLGMAAVIGSLSGRNWRARLSGGALAALGQFSIGLAWSVQFNIGGYVALVIAESAIVALGLSLAPPRGPLRVPGTAAVLVLAEWVRESWPFGGLPLGSAVLGQIGGPLQFAARLGGPLLVVFVLGLAGGGMAELALAAQGRFRRRGRGSPLLLAAAAALAGAGALAGPSVSAGALASPLRVAIVQGGGRRGLDALQVPPAHVFDAAVRETKQISGHPQVILWPEDVVAMGSTRFAGSTVEALLARIARQHHATLVAGVTQDVGRTRFLNEVVALAPSGHVVATFEKVHRVPFGEYVPLRGFFSHLANLSEVPRDAIAGTGSGMIATPAGRFGVLISFEDFFAGRGRSGVRAGAEVILVPTNTSSYSNDQAPAQEIAASRLQSIEEDRFVLQAAPTGYSAVISPSGVVMARTALSRPAVLEASVPLLRTVTPYEQAGDLPVLLGALALVGLGWAVVGKKVTARSSPTPRRRRTSPSR